MYRELVNNTFTSVLSKNHTEQALSERTARRCCCLAALQSLELARRNGDSKVGDSFPYNGVACSKATELTYCNVEWVTACAILPKTRLTLARCSPLQALTRSLHFPHPAKGASPPGRSTGGRLVPRRANERYTSVRPTLAHLDWQAYHRHPGRTRLSPPLPQLAHS